MATFVVLGNSQPAHCSEIKQNGRVPNQHLTCLHIAWGIETLSSSDLIFQRALNNCYVIYSHSVFFLKQMVKAGATYAAAGWPSSGSSCSQSFLRFKGRTDRHFSLKCSSLICWVSDWRKFAVFQRPVISLACLLSIFPPFLFCILVELKK